MAKTSQVNRNGMREHMAKRDKAKRARAEGDRDGPHAAGGGPLQRHAEAGAACRATARLVRVRLRCELTGRSRGNYRKFKLCRIKLRELANQGRSPAWSRRAGNGGNGQMAVSDPLGDMLTRIRNAQRARHSSCMAPASKLRANVLDVLKREGFIRGFAAEELRPGVAQLRIELKYNEGEPVIKEITRVSKPGRRVYSKIKELPRVYAGLGISILSTPRGVMSDAEARAANVGGEVLCRVF